MVFEMAEDAGDLASTQHIISSRPQFELIRDQQLHCVAK